MKVSFSFSPKNASAKNHDLQRSWRQINWYGEQPKKERYSKLAG
jgi:hypothetical protein